MRFGDIVLDSFNQQLKDFCEEYIRLAEMIILFDSDKMADVDAQEEYALNNFYARRKDEYTFLGENGIRNHFKIVRSRIIKETIEANIGVQTVYKKLCRYLYEHKIEMDSLKLEVKDPKNMLPTELYQNYDKVVTQLANIDLLIEGNKYKK